MWNLCCLVKTSKNEWEKWIKCANSTRKIRFYAMLWRNCKVSVNYLAFKNATRWNLKMPWKTFSHRKCVSYLVSPEMVKKRRKTSTPMNRHQHQVVSFCLKCCISILEYSIQCYEYVMNWPHRILSAKSTSKVTRTHIHNIHLNCSYNVIAPNLSHCIDLRTKKKERRLKWLYTFLHFSTLYYNANTMAIQSVYFD